MTRCSPSRGGVQASLDLHLKVLGPVMAWWPFLFVIHECIEDKLNSSVGLFLKKKTTISKEEMDYLVYVTSNFWTWMSAFTLWRLQTAAREEISRLWETGSVAHLHNTHNAVSDTQHSSQQSPIHILLRPCQDILAHEIILPSRRRQRPRWHSDNGYSIGCWNKGLSMSAPYSNTIIRVFPQCCWIQGEQVCRTVFLLHHIILGKMREFLWTEEQNYAPQQYS